MTKRKPRRKAPKKSQRSIGWIWWTAGLLSLGWFVFDANRSTILPYMPDLAAVANGQQSRAASADARSSPHVQTRTRSDSPRSSSPKSTAVESVPRPPARTASLARPSAPVLAIPTERPSVSGGGSARTVTSRRTPLYREPTSDSPVWVTLEAGKPLRITGRKGPWRRVEAGIFTGWIKAEVVETPARLQAMPTRSALVRADEGRPVPPGAIPNVRH